MIKVIDKTSEIKTAINVEHVQPYKFYKVESAGYHHGRILYINPSDSHYIVCYLGLGSWDKLNTLKEFNLQVREVDVELTITGFSK